MLTLQPNPLSERRAAPPALAYALPPDTIVQFNPDILGSHKPSSPTLNKARLASPWVFKEGRARVEPVPFEGRPGRVIARVHDRRGIAFNEHGLPDLGHPDLAAVRQGRRGLDSILFHNTRRDPDWARWRAGRYEVVTEHEEGETLGLAVTGSGVKVGSPRKEALGDGFVRTTWVIDAPDAFNHVSFTLSGGTARRWRRFAVYHTHAFPDRTGGMVPTGERALHEAGRIWSPRYLGMFAERYNALRFLDFFLLNNSAELPGDRSEMGKEGSWLLHATSLPYDHHPWDATRHLLGDHPVGVPTEAILRMAYEASLVAREAGREGHVVNPQVLMPFRFEGEAVDAFLGEIADHVRWAEARGVAYDYVKLGVYNEPWNSHPGAFRESHQHAARLPVSTREFFNEEARGYRAAPRTGLPGDAPWYTTEAQMAEQGTNPPAAEKAAARRMIHVLSRAHALHPDVNWIGEIAAKTGGGARSVKRTFEGARDGAADVEAWARDGDPWTGSKDYAVVPRGEDGRPQVGALFAYSLTSYYDLTGGPRGRLFAGLPHEELAARSGTPELHDAILARFLSLPARPAAPASDGYAYNSSLAGFRARYEEILSAVAAEGGAHVDLYEGGDHTMERHDWPDATKTAFRAWKRSPQQAEVSDRIHDLLLGLGLIGISDLSMVIYDERNGVPVNTPSWSEVGDPYETVPSAALWAKRMTPLTPKPQAE